MYTLRLLIIIFLMTASNLYAQQREADKANSVIMSSQANRLIERGEYEEIIIMFISFLFALWSWNL